MQEREEVNQTLGPQGSSVLVGQILAHYSDILRVGHLVVGTRIATWDTDGCMATVFSKFMGALREQWLSEVAAMANTSHAEYGVKQLPDIAYWVCKITSLNYCLSEVMFFLQRTFRKKSPLSVETYDYEHECALLEYGIYPSPVANEIAVELRWRRPGQITCVDVDTEQRSVLGELKSVKASFPVPPGPVCRPQFEVVFERSRAWRMPSFRSQSSGEVGHCSNATGLGDQSTLFLDASSGDSRAARESGESCQQIGPDRHRAFLARRPLLSDDSGSRRCPRLSECRCSGCRRRDWTILAIVFCVLAVLAVVIVVSASLRSPPPPATMHQLTNYDSEMPV